MKIISFYAAALVIVLLVGANHLCARAEKTANPTQPLTGDAEILQSWQGDYPVARLDLLPEKQRERAVGFIGDARTFEGVWKALKPGEDVPEVDFKANLVLFARNTQFYNRISIGKVNVKNGVAEVLAMETMSAMPIEDMVAMSLVVVPREGITSIRTRDGLVVISDDDEIDKSLRPQSQTAPQTYVYECSDGYSFIARIEEKKVWLFLPNQTLSLPLVPSASGAKYSKGQIVFWSKGGEAMLEIGEERHSRCNNNRAKAIWEDAKLRGLDFRAVGNEPGWHLELTAGEKVVFVGDYGNTVYVFVTPEPLVDQHTRTTSYKVQDAQHDLEVLIEGRPCQDSMSGEPFETTVTVILDGKKYRGCGKPL